MRVAISQPWIKRVMFQVSMNEDWEQGIIYFTADHLNFVLLGVR